MFYELVVLGTLMEGPFHGYLIAKIVQNILGPYGKMSAGRLYPLLAKLEAAGIVQAESEGGVASSPGQRSHVPSRGYQITDAGRARFHELMLNTTSYLGDYQKLFLQKVTYFSSLSPTDRRHLIDHYRGYCQELIDYGTAQARAVAALETGAPTGISMSEGRRRDLLTAMDHKIEQHRQELAWANALGQDG